MRQDRLRSGWNRKGSISMALPCLLVIFVHSACSDGGVEHPAAQTLTTASCAEEWKAVLTKVDATNDDSTRTVILEQGRTLFKRPGAEACERALLYELAKTYQRQEHTDRLIAVYDALLADKMRLLPEEAASVKMKLANACFSMGLARSFDVAKDVFRYYQDHEARSDKKLEATALLVGTYDLTGGTDSCISMLNGALKLAEKESDIRWTCDLLDRLGGIATREGRGSDAVRFHQRSLAELARFFRNGAVRDTLVKRSSEGDRNEMGDTGSTGIAHEEYLTQRHYLTMRHRAMKMLGDAHANMGLASIAAADYQRAIDLADTSFIREIVPPYTELGGIRLSQGNTAEAIRLGELGRARAQKDKDPELVRSAAELLHRAYKRQGDQGRALAMLELATAHGDSLSDEDFVVGLVKKQMTYAVQAHEDSMLVALGNSETERKLNDQRAQSNRNWTYVIGGASLLLLAASALWYRSDRKRRLERFEKDAAVLETQALRSQMNPHFIFNALNSINAFVQGNDPDMASSYLSKFARVMRLVLENSRHAEVPLESDLEALRGYLDLERKRMRDKFDYSIEIDPDIDPREVMVPPLVVQPFVENAIWHGMAGKEGQGHITLRIQQKGEQLLWIIEDDGIGRDAHRSIKDAQAGASSQFKETVAPVKKTSLGTAITRARLDLVQKQYGGKAGWNYVDTPTGTRVEVDMPMRVGS